MADNRPDYYAFAVAPGAEPIRTNRDQARRRYGERLPYAEQDNTLTEDVYDPENLTSLLLTAVNGSAELTPQTVKVEYLRNDQKLVIPTAMGMRITQGNDGRCLEQAVLKQRYWRMTRLSYAEMKAAVAAHREPVACRDALLDGMTVENSAVGNIRKVDWCNEAWWVQDDGSIDTYENSLITFGAVSKALQFNCDMRDSGILNNADMSVADNAWNNAETMPKERLRNKIQPYSLHAIACLNHAPCNGQALAAWTRAYGVAIGLIPSVTSVTVSEIRYVATMTTKDQRDVISAYERSAQMEIMSFALNLLGMFGLMHLNKDHTFRTGDQNMERIGRSYINALRTMTNVDMIDNCKANLEVYVRTAQHPFGLAQTYWLARAMASSSLLASPLAIRIDVCPPTVQRVLIVHAAEGEWSNIPGGMALSQVYRTPLADVAAAVTMVKASPPEYSALHHLYGVPAQSVLAPRVTENANKLMPCVWGYAMSQHVDNNNVKDGIALAMSLLNVEREHKAQAVMWQTIWDRYFDGVTDHGLISFAESAMGINVDAVPVGA